MAVTVTLVRQGPTEAVFDIIATADADVAAAVVHNLGMVPEKVCITPLAAAARLSLPIVTAIGAAQVTIGMTNAVGSGAAGAQMRVVVQLPPTVTR